MPDLELDLDAIRAARDLLDQTYVKWIGDDGKGGHCAVGCLIATNGALHHHPFLNDLAREMYPEHTGKRMPRAFGGYPDVFDQSPLVYVNNQLGKEATLALFDRRIADLEAKLATPVPADWKQKEKERVNV